MQDETLGPEALTEPARPEPSSPDLADTQDSAAKQKVPLEKREWIALGAVVGLALVLRLAYLIFGTGKLPLTSDAGQYFEIAKNLVNGHGFSMQYPGLVVHETAFRPPGYPLFLSLFFSVFGASAGLARALNLLLGLTVITLTFLLVRRYVGFVAATAAGLALAVMPNLIANDTYVLDEPLALVLIVSLIWALLAKRWWLSGACLGLLILTRPSAQLLIVVVAIWLLIHAGWRPVLKVALVAALLVSPWLIRNWVQLGEPIMVTSNGYNWAAIYSPTAQKAGGFIDPSLNKAYDKDRLIQLDELAWANFLQSQGIHALEHHPSYVLHILKGNFNTFFEITPSRNVAPERLDGRDITVVQDTLFVFYLELAVGLLGLALAWRTKIAQLFFLQGVYFALISFAFIAVPRLRSPFDLALAVGVGLSADALHRRRARRHEAREPALGAPEQVSTAL